VSRGLFQPSWESEFALARVCRAPTQVRQFAGMSSCIFMYISSMVLAEMGERVRVHDLANIARPQQPLGGLFSALRSSPVPQCMLAALYMSMHIHMCRFTLDVMAICRVSRTFSGIMLATRFPGVTAFRTCMTRITHAPAASSSCRCTLQLWRHRERHE
jgi:hypothetical protein